MDSPITRAFGLPELALHLEQFLFPRDIACLMQTCGTLYSTFLPRYAQKSQDFSALCLFHDKPQAPRSLRDVAINAFHLRTIMIDERSCRKYHDEFRDVYFPISPSPTSSSSSSPSSSSASPPDPPSPYQIPAQPSIESLCENRDLSVQVWCFLQGSPRLTTLHMHNIKIDDSFKAVWAATISKLKILETLYLDFVSMSESSILHAIRTIFAKRPTSLKSVTLRLHYASDLYVLCSRVDPAIDDPFLNVPALTISSNNNDGGQSTSLPYNNNNLPNPTGWKTINPSSPESYRPFLQMLFHCPNLVPMNSRQSRLNSPSPSPSSSLVVRLFAGGFLNKHILGVRRPRSISRMVSMQERCVKIFSTMMNVLEENTLETVKLTKYEGMEEGDEEKERKERVAEKSDPTETVESPPMTKTVITDYGLVKVEVQRRRLVKRKPSMRHFVSLRRFEIHRCPRLNFSLFRAVLFDCPHLEIFNILTTPMRLEDMIKEEWASTRIQELHITINTGVIQIPVGPNDRSEFDQQQKRVVARLNTLYRQLGRLTELKVLDTRRYLKRPAFHVDVDSDLSMSEYFLQGLLTVGDKFAEEGYQWGGLQLLSGLKSLTTLRGLFHADAATMPGFILGEKEVAWIADSWPKLERVEFYTGDHAVDSPTVLSSVD